jgi:hypothetical protein
MTPSKAIRAFCLQCMGGSAVFVNACRSKICPLVDYRFGRGQGRIKRKLLRDYCLHCVGGVRTEAVNCTDPDCPFYPYRPGTKGESPGHLQKLIEGGSHARFLPLKSPSGQGGNTKGSVDSE